MSIRRSRMRPILLLAVCAPILAGCPFPIARTETSSVPVVGSVVWSDGTPAADLAVAVSTEWNDPSCTTPRLHTRTDAAGTFQLPGTVERHETTWFVPMLDMAAPQFRLCVGIGDRLRPAYKGYVLGDTVTPDTVTCIAWEWEGIPRVSCTGRAKRAVVTGGRWTGDAGEGGEGFYRLFLTEEPTRVKGYKRPMDRPHVYVQWVEPRTAIPPEGTAAPYQVRTTVSLPFDRNIVWAIEDMHLWRREGRWMVSLHGYKHAFMNDMARAELVFELGPPGQATKVAGP